MRWVLNQDGDLIVGVDERELYVGPVGYEGKLLGWNLWVDDYMVGTFDNPQEARDEMMGILEDEVGCYTIKGGEYCEFK